MNAELPTQNILRIRRAIEDAAFKRGEDAPIVSRRGVRKDTGWLLDIRNISLRGSVLDDIGKVFWDTFRDSYPFQIGGIESAAIPLVAGLVTYGFTRENKADSAGFFIRKSRKKDGLMNMVEGTIIPGRPIILVDDLINSGKSFIRQVEVLEELGHSVHTVWCLIRFRDEEYYQYFRSRGIAVQNVFTLDDFADTLGTHNLTAREAPPPPQTHFVSKWKFASPRPSYEYVVPKSDPVLDETHIYVGSDQGTLWALTQSDGKVAWSYTIGSHRKGKGIFSSPLLHKGVVYFGGYDGNFYALDAATGKKKWISFEADWVGSSPAIAPELNLVFVGLEFGLWRKRGGIAALDATTGKTVWAYREMPCFTHSSPLYIARTQQVVIGSNDGCVYLFDAKTGKLIWKYRSGTPSEHELDTGFSAHDIKESFAYDPKQDCIVFGNRNGMLCSISRQHGTLLASFQAEFGFYSTPLVHDGHIYASSLDKNLYCIDIETGKEVWRWNGGARLFASPTLIEGHLFQGANTGRLTELDPKTGEEISSHTLPERITNRTAYNPETKRFFVPTFANEIYCLERA